MSATDQKQTSLHITLDQEGRLLFSEELRRIAAIEPGDTFEIAFVGDGILLRPCLDDGDEDPAVFWGPNWRFEMEEDQADIEAGRTIYYDSDEEFLASLS